MNTEDRLPFCPFCIDNLEEGERRKPKNYSGGGGTFAGSFSQQGWTCKDCDAGVSQISAVGSTVLTFIPAHMMGNRDEYKNRNYPLVWSEWIDGVFMVAGRIREGKIEKHRRLEWRKWVDDVARVKWPDVQWDENYHPLSGEGYTVWPAIMRAEYNHTIGNFHPGYVGNVIPLDLDLARPFYPPQIPRTDMRIYRRSAVGWEEVDSDYSWSFTVEEDPILKNNREFFERVFGTVFGTQTPYSYTEIANGYSNKPKGAPGVRPWYSLTVGNAEIEIGWRKRVVSIKATYPSEVDAKYIMSLAQRDSVTFESFGPEKVKTTDELEAQIKAEEPEVSESMLTHLLEYHRQKFPNGETCREGGWQNTSKKAEVVCIHAWKEATCVEYLAELVKLAVS